MEDMCDLAVRDWIRFPKPLAMLNHVHKRLLMVVLLPSQNTQQEPIVCPVLFRQLEGQAFQELDEGLHLDLLVLM